MQTVSNFYEIVTSGTPLLDVRAPVEFRRGTLCGAVNLPLLNDEERHQVGLCYRQRGSDAAIRLGHQLVSGEVRQRRINKWCAYLREYRQAVVYCARGGMRSAVSCEWIRQQCGITVSRVKGGYKAFRGYLLEQLMPEQIQSRPVILGGRTGCGKTILLNQLENSIDLEGLANHRGSSFGRHIKPQPSQATFENRLAWALVKHSHCGYSTLVLEAEGSNVGRCFLPKALAAFFAQSPYVVLEAALEERIQATYEEYVLHEQAAFRDVFGQEEGMTLWLTAMQSATERIRNRLGHERARTITLLQQQASDHQLKSGSAEEHKKWIAILLKDYYDPLYDYSIKNKQRACLFTGNTDEVLDFLKSYTG